MPPVLAQAFAPLLDGTVSLHLSACTKGCAHPAPATLAFVGMDCGAALVHDGPASGAARPVRLAADLPAAVASLAATLAARVAAVALLAALWGDNRALPVLVAGAGVSFCVNYLISKFFVFRPPAELKDSSP